MTPTKEIKETLIERHPYASGEWIAWPEVFFIDVFAIQFWQPNERIAYEVKVSRSDFRRELANPQKRQLALDLSTRYFFATPPGLVRKDEIPPEAGLVEVADGALHVVKRAPRREPRGFRESEMMSLLRMDLFRTGTADIKRKLDVSDRLLDAADAEMKKQGAAIEAAHEALERYVGELVQPGTFWRGPWRRLMPEDPEEAVIQVVRRIDREKSVDVVRVDRVAATRPSYMGRAVMGIGELLASHERVNIA